MNAHAWLALVACAGHFALFYLVITRLSRSPLSLPLAILASAFFTCSFSSLAWDVSGNDAWRFGMAVPTPIAHAVSLHFVLAFTGRRRQFAWLLFAVYGIFGAFSLLLVSGVFHPVTARFVFSPHWAVLALLLTSPVIVLCAVLLVFHGLRLRGEEAWRTWFLLTAVAWGMLLSATDVMAETGIDVPRLRNLGTLGASLIVAATVLRLRLFGDESDASSLPFIGVAAGFAVVGYLAVFRLAASSAAASTIIVVGVTLALIATTWRVWVAAALARQRTERLATLGRFSSQMAHDLKNPLSALAGATEFLLEERRRGHDLSAHASFLDLIAAQSQRLAQVIDQYQRLGRVEAFPTPLNLNEVARSVVGLQSFAATGAIAGAITVQTRLGDGLPDCKVDRDLVAGALENLLRNAFEAMPKGGAVTVSTGRDTGLHGGARVFVEVRDEGEGMDARTRERAFDDFFTTKPRGTGHGLAFVRRVMDAHGGGLALDSKQGAGTTIRLSFPVGS